MSSGVALCFVVAALLAIVAMIVIAISAGLARHAVIGVLVFGLILVAIALQGCAACPRPPSVAPTCVVTQPPPDVQEQDDVEPLIAWANDTWLRCASMRAEDYPASPVFEEADDGEDLE